MRSIPSAFMAASLLVSSALLPLPSVAQTTPEAATPAAPTAGGVTGSNSASAIFAPSHLQAARDVVVGSGIARSFDSFIPQFVDQAKGSMSSTRPELIKDLEEIAVILPPKLADMRAEVVDIGARAYANRLTEVELKEISAFFKTPAGSKYISTQPQTLEDLFTEMQGWSQRLGVRVVELFREELQKRGRDVN